MANKKGVSSKTHTKKQLDDYANQHNPNNKAYKARVENDRNTKKVSSKHEANVKLRNGLNLKRKMV